MTWIARLMYAAPACHLLLIAGAFVAFLLHPGPAAAGGVVAAVWLAPLVAFRVHDRIWPLREGRSHLIGGGYNPWWGASQLQWTFIAFPALETVLRAVPGLFSAWLRAWGSRVGDGVIWTPDFTVLDRSLLDVGDGVVFGHRVGISGHLVAKGGNNLQLVVARVRIGEHTLIGAGSVLGPGVNIGARAHIGGECRFGPYARVGDGAHLGSGCTLELRAKVAADARVPSHQVVTATG